MPNTPCPGTPRKSEKRAPTTPLVPSKHQNKKNSSAKLEYTVSKPLKMEVLSGPPGSSGPQKGNDEKLLEARFEIWTLQKRWKEEKELSSFLELERTFGEV